MRSAVRAAPLHAVTTPLLAVAVPKLPKGKPGRGEGGGGTGGEPRTDAVRGERELPPTLVQLDAHSGGALRRAIADGDFTGARDETALVYAPAPTAPGTGRAPNRVGTGRAGRLASGTRAVRRAPGAPGAPGRAASGGEAGPEDEEGPQRVLLVGVGEPRTSAVRGEPKGWLRQAVRRAAGIAARRAKSLGTRSFAFAMPAAMRAGLAAADFAQVAVEGAAAGAFAYDALKAPNDDRKPPVESLEIVVEKAEAEGAEGGAAVGQAIAEAQDLTRRLQVLPPNTCTPEYLAEVAREVGARHGLAVTVLDRAAIEAEGMGALLAVAQGSARDPRFITLEYRGTGARGHGGTEGRGAKAGEGPPPVVLVGKGITFDTGGISIKPAQAMEEMKYDMSGAAAVLGAMDAVGRLALELNVVGVIPACENMPSGSATRPADVVKSHSGKTIEVVNTDAEGRLILADALSYARRFKPAAVLDAATLTGAVVVGLGHVVSAVMGNDEALVEEVRRAGEKSGERAWPLPLLDEYREQNKSDIADIKNSAGRAAATITAGWFLGEFAEGYPWAHLDVAGTAWSDTDAPHQAKGPTGTPMRLFVEFLIGRAAG